MLDSVAKTCISSERSQWAALQAVFVRLDAKEREKEVRPDVLVPVEFLHFAGLLQCSSKIPLLHSCVPNAQTVPIRFSCGNPMNQMGPKPDGQGTFSHGADGQEQI